MTMTITRIAAVPVRDLSDMTSSFRWATAIFSVASAPFVTSEGHRNKCIRRPVGAAENLGCPMMKLHLSALCHSDARAQRHRRNLLFAGDSRPRLSGGPAVSAARCRRRNNQAEPLFSRASKGCGGTETRAINFFTEPSRSIRTLQSAGTCHATSSVLSGSIYLIISPVWRRP
jgi:hypothetical protein